MKLTFTKEVPKTYYHEGHGYLRKCKLYTIYNDEHPIGRFLYHYNLCSFSFSDQSYHIDIERHYFKRSKYYLVDDRTQTRIGEYKLSGGMIHIGILTIDGQNIFVCDKVRPNVRYSILDPKTWGHFKIQVTNRINAAEYDFRLKLPFFRTSYEMYPFSGELELWGDNLLLAFAGLFLLEWALELENS